MKAFIKTTVVAISLTISSCNFLEVQPISEITSDNFFKTAGDAESALIGCYDALQSFTYSRDVMMIPDIMSDALRANSGGNFQGHEAFNPSPVQGNLNQIWQWSYLAIQRCLDVLENVPAIADPALNEERKNRILGEAHFIRGLSYFNLVRLFGKVPIVLKATKSPDQDFLLKRNEVAEVYTQAINDLLEAEKLLPATRSNKSFPAKGSARALLARVYMTRNTQGDLDKALAECVEVMADAQYSLVPGDKYAELFVPRAQNTSESLFEISYRPNFPQEAQSNFDLEMVPAQGNSFRVRPTDRIINAFTANDLRKNVALGTFNGNPYVKKHEAGPPTITNNRRVLDPNIVVLRLADVILMRAECLNETGKTDEAIPFLNQIRTRAGLAATTATTQSEVRLAIEEERFLELCFEGSRWYDLVRTNRVEAFIPNFTNKDRAIWPIPARELDLNPNLLPQNPSY